jgi:signal transduction histidine kinase
MKTDQKKGKKNSKISSSSRKINLYIKELENSRRAILNILEDVETEKRKAEEEKNKTLAVITNLVDGLLVFDQEDNLELINPQAEILLKVKSADVKGRNIFNLSSFSSFKPLVECWNENGQKIFRKEISFGENLVLEVSFVPLVNNEKNFGKIIILHDITRDKLIEKLKTEFVSVAAHQLRTPLSAIKWTLRMILDGEVGEITDEQREFLEKTYEANERMILLINDLLNVAKIEEGRYFYRAYLTDLEPIVKSMVDYYQEEAKRKSIKLEFVKMSDYFPRVMIDPEKIKLAIQNLLDNALHYTPKGGSVTVTLIHGDKDVLCSIKDNGVGIPKSQQSRVFTKFFRAENVIRMQTEGSGLGLFITKNIIEAHNGKIWFESEEGKGTTFYFSLPIKDELGKFLEKL